MSTTRTPTEILAAALGQALDRVLKRHPDLQVAQVCGALGTVAGTCVAVNVPAGHPDADVMIGNVMGVAFGEAVIAARKARAS